jgi:hypothetical protein
LAKNKLAFAKKVCHHCNKNDQKWGKNDVSSCGDAQYLQLITAVLPVRVHAFYR